jgi:hypothetical protein
LFDFAHCQVVTAGHYGCGRLSFDDVENHGGFASSSPAFDVFVLRIHETPPFQLVHNLGLPAPDPGKLSSA